MKYKTQKKSDNIIRNPFVTGLRMTGFTVIEMVTALMVSFIILTAVVTLAYAMNSAYESTRDISKSQVIIRNTIIRISELIKKSRLICDASADELVIWREDTNNDNRINLSEITYIETGMGKYLRLLQFNPVPGSDFALSLPIIRSAYMKAFLKYRYKETYTMLLEQCSSMNITLDKDPPYTRVVNISFDIEENQQIRTCQISSVLRCHISSLINIYGTLSSSDDDLPQSIQK